MEIFSGARFRDVFRRDKRPVLLEVRSSTWFITSAVCTAIFTDIFLYAVIVPVFPFSLQDRVGIPEHRVQHWLSVLLAVYAAGLLAGSCICGYLADRIEYRQWPLLMGLIAVAASTALLCVAKSIALLVVGRVLQGIAASVIWVVGLALLSDTVPKNEIARSLGYVGTALSLGTLVAPLLGGIVYQQAGYYAVFGMSFGVIALDIVLRLLLIEKKAARKWLDDESEKPESETPSSEVGDVEALPTHDSEKAQAELAPVVEVAGRKRRVPPILTLCTSRRMLAAIWGSVALSIFMCGLDTTLTLFVSRTFGYNSLQAGLVFLAVLLPTFFGPVVGLFVDKYGSRWIGAFGFFFMVVPWILMRLVDHNSLRQKVLLCALLVLVGLGIATSLTAVMAEFSKMCDAKEKKKPGQFGKNGAYAQSYGLFNGAWALGSIIGAFWSGGVYDDAGWGTMGLSFAILSAFTGIPVLLLTDGWIGRRKSAV